MVISSGSPTVQNCVFLENSSTQHGGAIAVNGGAPLILNCVFVDNVCGEQGGAIYCNWTSYSSIINCTLYGNSAPLGAGVMIETGDTSIEIMKNCILYGNTPSQINGGAISTKVEYCNIQGGCPGTGNIDADPKFWNAASGDFRLAYASPCFDAGTPTGAPTDDIDGNPRPVDIAGVGFDGPGEGFDMGAYEMPLVVYVDVDTPAAEIAQDDQTWVTAFNEIQEGIDAAYSASGGEVWVAEGVYVGATVLMKENVHLYGGFSGTETAQSQRDWNVHQTSMDGENLRRCVVGANASSIDGFLIERGNAAQGAGMLNDNTSPRVSNYVFFRNATYGDGVSGEGGGMYNTNSAAVVDKCKFVNNKGNYGGGIYNDASSPEVTNCIFIDNANSTGSGAGIYNLASNLSVINSTFYGNWAQYNSNGSAISSWSSQVALKNSILWNNQGVEIEGTCNATYSDIDGGYVGTGNMNLNPLFVDAANGNLRLGASSPVIDSGTASSAPSKDILGVLCPQGAGIDMGRTNLC